MMRSKLIRISILFGLTVALRADNISWSVAPVTDAWSNAANWSCPTCGSSVFPDNGNLGLTFDVLIGSGSGADHVTLDATRAVNSLTLGSSATLVMSPGKNLVLTPPDQFSPQLVNAGAIQVKNSVLTLNTLVPFIGFSPTTDNSGNINLTGAAAKLILDDAGVPGIVKTSLTGSGSLSLMGGSIQGAHGSEVLITGNSISGFGSLSNLGLVLNGNTSAVGGNVTIASPPSISGFNMLQNFGVMTATSGDLIFAPSAGSTIVNNGTIQTGGGNIQLQLAGSQFLSNTITVGDGRTLSMAVAGTLVNSGTVSLTSTGNPTTLQLSGSGETFSLDGAGTYQLSGAGISGVSGGEVLVDGSKTTIQGNGVISHLASFTNSGTLRPSGGPLVIAGDVGSFANTGTIVIDAGASMTVLAPFTRDQFGGIVGNFDLAGTLQVTAPIDALGLGSTLRLSGTGGFVDPLGANAIANISTLPLDTVLDNHASLTLNNSSILAIRLSLHEGSTLNATNLLFTNLLSLSGGSTVTTGELFGISMNLSGGSSLTVLNGFSGVLGLTTSGGGNIFRAAGLSVGTTALNIGAGDLVDLRTTSGAMVDTFGALFGNEFISDRGAQVIAGTVRYDGSARLYGADILAVGGFAALTLRGDGQILYGAGTGTDAFEHLQVIDSVAGFSLDSLTAPRTITPLRGTLTIGPDTASVFNVLGGTILNIQGDMKTSGAVFFDPTLSHLNVLGGSKLTVTGNVINEGDTVIGTGSELDAANYFQNAGFTQNDGTLKANLVLAGGAFKGMGTLQGEFQQTGGTFSPGDSPGTLQVNGDYIQLGGTLVIEFGPSNADRLSATGDIELDGLLQFMLAGYQPHLGDTFDILDFRYIRLGPAFQFSGRTLGSGLFLNIGWGLHDMQVTVGNSLLPVPPPPQTPEPATVLAIAGGLIAIAVRRRRR